MMEPKVKVIGVTTEIDRIARMLGVESENEYGLYQETEMGRYYAKILSDGNLDNKLVRFIKQEQAAEIEKATCAIIDGANIQEITKNIPEIDMDKFNQNINTNMDTLISQINKNVENMQKAVSAVPTIDMDKFNHEMELLDAKVKEQTKQIKKNYENIQNIICSAPTINIPKSNSI